MDFLTINDVATRSGLPKPTVYRMFHEMNDLIPHKRVGRKILFPEEALAKITEIRRLTKEEGLTYKMIKEEALISLEVDANSKNETDNNTVGQLAPRVSEIVSRSIASGFEGLREDLRLLAAQIDRQNDLLARYLAHTQGLEEAAPSRIEEEFMMVHGESEAEEKGATDFSDAEGDSDYTQASNFRIKWSNFWAGRGWRA